jgi:hypothetical protein
MSDDATCSSLGPGQGLTVIAAKIKLAVALVQRCNTHPYDTSTVCSSVLSLFLVLGSRT